MTDAGLEESDFVPSENPDLESQPIEEPEVSARNESSMRAGSGFLGIIYSNFLSLFGYSV